jgi:hypothetical protein
MRLVNFFLLLLIWGEPALANNFFPKPTIVKIHAPLKNREEAYHYGYNGQMKDNEWAGLGNHNSAKYWEYDTRTTQRANPDPVSNPSRSSYATFNRNPILNKDVEGNVGEPVVNGNTLAIYSDVYFYGGASTGKLAATAANNMQSEWSAAHGSITFQGKEFCTDRKRKRSRKSRCRRGGGWR